MSSPPVATGVFSLRPRYLVRGSPASWVWYLLSGSVPSHSQMRAAAQAFTTWDLGGFEVGSIGYAFFRALDTELLGVECRSIDPRNYGDSAIVQIHEGGSGLGPDQALNACVAPFVGWATVVGSNRHRGRTYCVGLGHSVVASSDPDRFGAATSPALPALFTTWPTVLLDSGFPLPVLLSYQRGGNAYADSPVSLIDRATFFTTLFGTQRRRLQRRGAERPD